tara:strand:- start:523 stop:1026 length:504 start_codon:yes stop_codon:yes gene_type:complete
MTKPKRKVKSGSRKRRAKRPVEKNLITGYDSNWEYELHTGPLKDWSIHTDKVYYVINHSYTPDFIKRLDGKLIYLEAKGRFWDYQEYNKYIWVRKALPENTELVFLFANPSAPMPQAKRRQDGTKRSHAEWAEANKFRWFGKYSLPKEWIDPNSIILENEDYPEEAE